jgi:hypothetical protein
VKIEVFIQPTGSWILYHSSLARMRHTEPCLVSTFQVLAPPANTPFINLVDNEEDAQAISHAQTPPVLSSPMLSSSNSRSSSPLSIETLEPEEQFDFNHTHVNKIMNVNWASLYEELAYVSLDSL